MSNRYRLKSDHAVECSLREPGKGSWVFLVRDCVPRGTLEQPWDRSYFDKLWEPIPESAPPSAVLVEDELGRFAGQLDGRKADGDKPKPRKVLITMPWHWFPGSPIVPIPATIEELPE